MIEKLRFYDLISNDVCSNFTIFPNINMTLSELSETAKYNSSFNRRRGVDILDIDFFALKNAVRYAIEENTR